MCILTHFSIQTIKVLIVNGDQIEVPALVYGKFAIHKHIAGDGYTVTTVASGRGSSHPFPTLESAARGIALLNGVPLMWDTPDRNPLATTEDLYGDRGYSIRAVLEPMLQRIAG